MLKDCLSQGKTTKIMSYFLSLNIHNGNVISFKDNLRDTHGVLKKAAPPILLVAQKTICIVKQT